MRNASVLAVFTLAINAGVSDGVVYHGIAVPPGGTHAWVAWQEGSVVYRTADFGQTWECVHLPTGREPMDVFFTDTMCGWTCGEVGDILHTTDGGRSWHRQSLGGPFCAWRIRFNSSVGWASGTNLILCHTTNGGSAWDYHFLEFPGIDYDSFEFQGTSFPTAETGWAVTGVVISYFHRTELQGGQGLVIGTTNAGDSWELLLRDTTFDFYDVCFADSRTGVVVGGNDSDMTAAVKLTTDAGATWGLRSVPGGSGFLFALEFEGPSLGWACGSGGTILHTTNCGETWSKQTTPTESTLYDIEFADQWRGMACGAGVVLVTTNGGETWNESFIGIAEQPAMPGPAETRLCVRANPVRGLPEFVFSARLADRRVAIFDSRGCRVGCVSPAERRTTHSRRLTAGIYFAMLADRSEQSTVRFVVLP